MTNIETISQTPIAELPLLGWTEQVHPKFSEKTLGQAVTSMAYRAEKVARDLRRNRQKSMLISADKLVQPAIDEIFKEYAGKDTQLLQIGAYDGVFDDPFVGLIKDNDWAAVLVEPQIEAYTRLEEHYSGNSRVKCINKAVNTNSNEESSFKLWRAKLPDSSVFGGAIASRSPEQVRREVLRCAGWFALRNSTLESEVVTAASLNEIIEISGSSPDEITIFACDTEGDDAKITQALIQDIGARPQVIQWEHLHVPSDEANRLDRHLDVLGYQSIKTHKDTIAFL